MARKIRNSALESRSARLRLPVRRKPHPGPSLARGISLLYRRNKGNGTWVLKASDHHGNYWTKSIGQSDDYEVADGKTVLTFFEAQDVAKKLARGEDGAADSAPITVDAALKDYKRDLEARGAGAYNAEHPRVHLTPVLLAKPVQLLTSAELRKWRDSLLGKIAPATISRVCNSLCAAFELAAQHDDRIQNRSAWETGLAGLPDAQRARNVVISDDQVRAFIAEAYARDAGLGLLVETLAVTGARSSQAVRLKVEDLHDHPLRPKVMMPKSGKGGGRNRSQRRHEHYAVPIPPHLARKLKAAVQSRPGEAPLLVRSDGSPWGDAPSQNYQQAVREIVAAIGLDPDTVTMYALRRSNITRMLLANTPIRLVASLHDTSVGMIERNYSKHITEHADADDHARVAMLQPEEPTLAADNVVPLTR